MTGPWLLERDVRFYLRFSLSQPLYRSEPYVLFVAVHHRLLSAHPGLCKKIASAPRTCWLSVATVPAGGGIPQKLETMKLLTRACSSVVLIAISRLKCFLSDFG